MLVGIERIAGPKSQFVADATGENDLTFGGNLGLHGKTILGHVSGTDKKCHSSEGPQLRLKVNSQQKFPRK
jgi:hypothetical protein